MMSNGSAASTWTGSRAAPSTSMRGRRSGGSSWHACCGAYPDGRRSTRPSSPTIEETFMKAVVFHGVGDSRLDNVPEPRIQQPTDAIVRPSQVLRWAVNVLAKAGTLAIIGVYPATACFFPAGDCNEPQPHHQDGQL